MTHEQRNTAAALFTNLLVTGFFVWRLASLHGQGAFAGPDGLRVWAQNALWMIPASIVITIVVTIIVTILFAIATGDEKPSMVVDERDKAFGLKGLQVTVVVASGGFIVALGGLAMGWQALLAFNISLAGFALGDLLGNVAKLFLYRRGT